ncbi:hypothetical protein TNCV_1801351 [Trichonephila clavipes]|nr:hypothetical protein TNCV_1801351 [Trichonephila clavipes]
MTESSQIFGVSRGTVPKIITAQTTQLDNLSKSLQYGIDVFRHISLRTFGAAVASGQGIGSSQACHECEPSTTKDSPCREAMHLKSAESSIVFLLVLDESRSFFRVHTGYFSNIPKCIKAEFIASWACSQSSVVSSSKR